MTSIGFQVVGDAGECLVITLPAHVSDESSTRILQEVRSRLPQVSDPCLVLDFSGVTLLNSIGITCLLQLQDECRKRRARLCLAALPDVIFRFLEQLKLDRRFRIVPSVDSALSRGSAA
jgi:anti-anti-sigma factor